MDDQMMQEGMEEKKEEMPMDGAEMPAEGMTEEMPEGGEKKEEDAEAM